jgi:ABC-type bacteriocin/lantibiotic exporter with double-glycine peptidase domain
MNIKVIFSDISTLTGVLKKKELIKLAFVQLWAVMFELTTIISVFLFIKTVVSRDIQNDQVVYLGSILIGYILVGAIFRIYSTNKIFSFSMGIEKLISANLMKSYFSKNYIWHKKNSTAELGKTILQDASQIISGYILPILTILISSSVVLTLGIVGVVLAPVLIGSFFVLLITLVLLVALLSKPLLKRLSQLKENAAKERYRFVSEVFNNRTEIYLESQSSDVISELGKINDGYCIPQTRYLTVVAAPLQFIEALILIIIVAVVLASAVIFEHSAISDQLIVSMLIVARMLPHVNRLSGSISTLNYFQGLVNDVVDKIRGSHNPSVCYSSLSEFTKLSICDGFVSIDGKNIIENLNITIENGDKILIQGESGSGKSTLVEIVSGLLDLTSGNLYLDGKEKPRNEILNRLVTYVPQSIFLQDLSIRELVCDGGGIDEFKFNKIINAMGLSDVEHRFGESNIGDNGNKLSGGQRQRIGIARALYREKPIIILDESTSGLDSKLECKVLDYLLDATDKTIILISHTGTAKKVFSKKLEFNREGEFYNVVANY